MDVYKQQEIIVVRIPQMVVKMILVIYLCVREVKHFRSTLAVSARADVFGLCYLTGGSRGPLIIATPPTDLGVVRALAELPHSNRP